jgi:hypothetical protein
MLQDSRRSYIRQERRGPPSRTFMSWLLALTVAAALLLFFASVKISAIVNPEDVSLAYSP